MNRFQPVDVAHEARRTTASKHASRYEQQRAPNHRFFIPLHYEKNYAYPLLVWLHGPTGCEFEVNQVMPHISMRNYVAVSPRGVVKHAAVHPNGDPTFSWDQEVRSVETARDDVLQCIRLAKRRFNIASDRVFLVGNDAGGTMALRLALANPQHFAGAASIGGAMPKTRCPLASYDAARSMPVLLTYGQESDQYTTDDACTDVRLLYSAGMSVSFRQYPCGHEVTTKMLSDVNCWMMEQISGQPSEVVCYDDPTHLRVRDCN